MTRRRVCTTPSHPPLKRCERGVWKSRDGDWTFMRLQGDPYPQRWMAYEGDSEWPSNAGEGHTRLADVANWALGDLP